jgi:glycogen debranching enzyme
MSKQWGHGFHTGSKAGVTKGLAIGETTGRFQFAEHMWHVISSAVQSIEAGNDMQALGILRASLFMVAHATGRDSPEYGKNEVAP